MMRSASTQGNYPSSKSSFKRDGGVEGSLAGKGSANDHLCVREKKRKSIGRTSRASRETRTNISSVAMKNDPEIALKERKTITLEGGQQEFRAPKTLGVRRGGSKFQERFHMSRAKNFGSHRTNTGKRRGSMMKECSELRGGGGRSRLIKLLLLQGPRLHLRLGGAI